MSLPHKPVQKRRHPFGILWSAISSVGKLAFAVAGGWIVYSHFVIDHDLPLRKALSADRIDFVDGLGPINIYADKSHRGRPLILIHSINAAASAYEMRPLFAYYRTARPVFAPDLPGFGLSSRTQRDYSPEFFTQAILGVLQDQLQEPADVIAHSLSCEFAARAALQRPELFHSLVFLSPSGFNRSDRDHAAQKASNSDSANRAYSLLSFPLWAGPLYDLIVTRRSIRYFLQRSFVGPVPDDLAGYSYATSHQPGARHAPLHFVSGGLFTPDVRTKVYAHLKVPVLVLYDRDAFVSFDYLPELLDQNRHFQAMRVTPTLGIPHWEKLAETTQAIDGFWQGIAGA